MVAIVVLLFAVTVKQDQAPLRESCGESEPVLTKMAAGTPVEVRFVLSDGSDCYKIAATVDGKQQVGYVTKDQLSGLESFDQQRRNAASVTGSSAAAPPIRQTPIPRSNDPLLGGIVDLLNTNQPAKALERIEPLLKLNPRNTILLDLAGMASYRTDDVRHALEYWKLSLDIQPDERVAALYRQAQQEASSDKSGEKLYGMRVVLRYEGASLPADTARSMLGVLDEQFARISDELGCATDERITAVVQSRQAYLQTTGAAEWSGGQYDGRIHVSADAGTLTPQMRETLTHEMVHACLANIGSFPAWVHEGLAQKLSGARLPAGARSELQQAIAAGAIPKLEQMGATFSRMDSTHARLAYDLALAAAEEMVDRHAGYGLRNIVHNPDMLARITPEIDKALGL